MKTVKVTRMKTVKVTRAPAFEMTCPDCHSLIETPDNGSLMWTPESFRIFAPVGPCRAAATCQECGEEFRFTVPKAAQG